MYIMSRDGGLMAVDRFKLVDKIQWVQDNLDSLSSAMRDLYRQAERSIIDVPDDGQTVNININDLQEEDCELLDALCDWIAAQKGIVWTGFNVEESE